MRTSATTLTEPTREIPIRHTADVVVCGGGPAGVAAAVAAARRGADTLLLERYGCLGGLATGGLVLVLPSFEDSGRPIIGGIGLETRTRLVEAGASVCRGGADAAFFDPEALKWLSQHMVRESGARILHHVWIASAHVEGQRVRAAIVESKAGRFAVAGRVFIDCTGDGDLFAAAGASFEASTQQIGLPFRLCHVDVARWKQAAADDRAAVGEAIQAAARRAGFEGWLGLEAMPTPDGLVWCNNMLCDRDGLSPEDLSYVETAGRDAIRRIVTELRATVPGFERAWLVDTASQVGVRRSRRLIGEYVMGDEDTAQFDRRFDDAVGRGNDFRQQGIAFDFPYRALVPREVDGLLVAGRCVSCSHEALEPIREIHNCWVMGEAAGTAAALSLRLGCPVRDVPIASLQADLRGAGVVL
ncbi:MAG TPA: FAD-dependent oxidoreductase [Armatimonadota bacterium]|nr:FAD-dependent oxidoreductase [Armatimonadota bacterium]